MSVVRRVLGRAAEAAPTDEFAKFRSIGGPKLVSGPTPRHDPALDGDPRLVVLLPHLDLERMSGGPNTVFQVTARLAARGHRLRYVATSGPLQPDAAALAGHVRRVTGVDVPPDAVDFVDASATRATVDLGRDDVLVASWWPTAHLANAGLALTRAKRFLYVIQDFEPGFYPWSTKSALAEATYSMPMRGIVNEPFLDALPARCGVGQFADEAWPRQTFMPAVDRAVFRPARADRPVGAPRRLASTPGRATRATSSRSGCGCCGSRPPQACSTPARGSSSPWDRTSRTCRCPTVTCFVVSRGCRTRPTGRCWNPRTCCCR